MNQAAGQILRWMFLVCRGCCSCSCFVEDAPLRQDEELEVNVFHTSAVLSACSRSKQWQLALDLLECQRVNEVGLSASLGDICRMRNCASIFHVSQGFNAFLDSCEKAGHMDLAFKMFSTMSERSLQPDVISCNTALRAASSSQHWQLGLAFLDGAEVDVISYTSCMNCCQGDLWQIALAFWDLIQIAHFEPSSRAFNSAIHAVRAEWTAAHQIFQEMLASGTSADQYTLSSLVHTSWELSFSIRSIGLARIDRAACNALLDSGPWTVGLAILQEMQLDRIYVGCVGYTALGRAIGSLRWSQGEALLSQMRRMEARPL